METVLSNGFFEMTTDEMIMIDGGEWDWKEFNQSIIGGAVGGAAGGAVTGAMAGGVGALPGAVAGGVAGGVAGAATYLAVGWW